MGVLSLVMVAGLDCRVPARTAVPPEPMLTVAGVIRTERDSVPISDVTVMLLGSADHAHGGMVVGTRTSRGGRFTLLWDGHQRLRCQTMVLRLAIVGWMPWESRPGSLLCTSRCQWLDIRLRMVQGRIDGFYPFDVKPVPCTPGRGYPAAPKM